MTLPIDTVLVRHGESEGNLAKRLSEQGDHSIMTTQFLDRHTASWRLTDKGRDQAARAGKWIQEEFFNGPVGFDRYMVSEYIRAMETAGCMGLPNALWHSEYRLAERSWGELDQYSEEKRNEKFADNLRRRDVEPFFWKPLNGESFSELTTRFDRVLDTLHRECSDKRVGIVCHGEMMWAGRVAIERMPQERFKELHLSKNPDDRIWNCQIIHYTRRDPVTGELHKHANWMRMIRPTADPIQIFPWTRIERPVYTNEDLVSLASKTEAMVA